jgi:hypothetical protein
MAEAIALATSIIAIIEVVDRVIGLAKFYIEASKNTPSDIRVILVEISTIKTIGESLQYLEAQGHIPPTLAKQIDGVLKECRQNIAELENLLPSDSIPPTSQVQTVSTSKRRKVQAVLTVWAWPLKVTKAKSLLKKIAECKALLNLALATDSL